MIDPSLVESRLREGLNELSYLELRDLTGTQDHYEAIIVAGEFASKSPIEQHQRVYAVLGELMHGPIHALALKTYSPDAASKAGIASAVST